MTLVYGLLLLSFVSYFPHNVAVSASLSDQDKASIFHDDFRKKVEDSKEFKNLQDQLTEVNTTLQDKTLSKDSRYQLFNERQTLLAKIQRLYRTYREQEKSKKPGLLSRFGIKPSLPIQHARQEASAGEFSGAIEWAHLKGITGTGAKVLVFD